MGGIGRMVGDIMSAVGAASGPRGAGGGSAVAAGAAPAPAADAPRGQPAFGGRDLDTISRTSGTPSSVPLPEPPREEGPNGLEIAGDVLRNLFGNSSGGGPFGNSGGGPFGNRSGGPFGNRSGGSPFGDSGWPESSGGDFPRSGGGNSFRELFDPVMLDLDGDGRLGTTGASTARDRQDRTLGKTVQFDMDGDGRKDTIEWMDGRGDGMLVDDRDGGVSAAMRGNGEIDGKRLFGDQDGHAHGFDKLKEADANGDGRLTGQELEGLKVWIDDGDARVEAGELKTHAELGISEIGTGMQLQQNARGETLMRGGFVKDGERRVAEDVWFGGQTA